MYPEQYDNDINNPGKKEQRNGQPCNVSRIYGLHYVHLFFAVNLRYNQYNKTHQHIEQYKNYIYE